MTMLLSNELGFYTGAGEEEVRSVTDRNKGEN
jgi:hypothetical protein